MQCCHPKTNEREFEATVEPLPADSEDGEVHPESAANGTCSDAETKSLKELPTVETATDQLLIKVLKELEELQTWRLSVDSKLNNETCNEEACVDEKTLEMQEEVSIWLNVADVSESHMDYEWEDSVYDGLLVVFMSHVGITFMQSVAVVTGFVLNSAMVIIILNVIGRSDFIGSGYDIEALRGWRDTDGHASSLTDALTDVTLVNRVCHKDDSLSYATYQTSIVIEIDQYLSGRDGQLLGNVAVALWVCCCLEEFRKAARFGAAILNFPRAERTTLCTKDDVIKIAGMSKGRTIMCLAVAIIRGVFSFILMFAGGLWLANESSISTLLLNASALGFVLDIDNVIFGLVAPLHVIGLLKSLAPGLLPNQGNLRLLIPMLMLFVGASFMVYSNIYYISPLVDNLIEVRETMCGPDENLNYAITGSAMGWLLYAITPDFGGGYQGPFMDAMLGTVRDLTTQPMHSGATRKAVRVGSAGELRIWAVADVDDLVSRFSCVDNHAIFPFDDGSLGDRLWAVSGNPALSNVVSCDEVQHLCFMLPNMTNYSIADYFLGINVRFMCARSCGCGGVHSGFWDLARTSYGCPQEHCQRQMLRTLKNPELSPCKDKDENMTDLERSGWNRLLDRLEVTRTIPENMRSNFSTMGCKALQFAPSGRIRDVCSMNVGFMDHGMAPFCPESCRCADALSIGAKENCPGLCPQSCCTLTH